MPRSYDFRVPNLDQRPDAVQDPLQPELDVVATKFVIEVAPVHRRGYAGTPLTRLKSTGPPMVAMRQAARF